MEVSMGSRCRKDEDGGGRLRRRDDDCREEFARRTAVDDIMLFDVDVLETITLLLTAE